MAANDFLFGEEGNDYIEGGDGSDLIFGGSGDDTMNCGACDDRFTGALGDDVLRRGVGEEKTRFTAEFTTTRWKEAQMQIFLSFCARPVPGDTTVYDDAGRGDDAALILDFDSAERDTIIFKTMKR